MASSLACEQAHLCVTRASGEEESDPEVEEVLQCEPARRLSRNESLYLTGLSVKLSLNLRPRIDMVSSYLRCNNLRSGLLKCPAHTTPVKFENGAFLLLRLGATVHNKPSRKGSFSKTLYKPEEFENAGFVWTENILKTELFENDDFALVT